MNKKVARNKIEKAVVTEELINNPEHSTSHAINADISIDKSNTQHMEMEQKIDLLIKENNYLLQLQQLGLHLPRLKYRDRWDKI